MQYQVKINNKFFLKYLNQLIYLKKISLINYILLFYNFIFSLNVYA